MYLSAAQEKIHLGHGAYTPVYYSEQEYIPLYLLSDSLCLDRAAKAMIAEAWSELRLKAQGL